MRQFRVNRTNALLLGLGMAGFCGVSYGAEVPLVFENEDVARFTAMQISKTVGDSSQTTTLRSQVPILCGSASSQTPPVGFRNRINPLFPGRFAGGDFKFGSLSGGTQSAVAGIGFWNYRPNGLTVQGDGKTSCYVLNTQGVRKASAGLFSDTFEDPGRFDASITTSVASLPTFSNPYFTYYVDVRIPPDFKDFEYRVRDGFDSSIFAFGSQAARYCSVAIGVTECAVSSMISDNIEVPSVVPATGISQRYIVQRQLHSSVTLPTDTTVPLTMAALFLVEGAETNLANNVSVGYAELSDLSPVITTLGTTVPSNLQEGQGATNLSFIISDDTSEIGLPALNAAVTIDFNGNLRPATNLTCTQIEAPLSGEAVRRTCRFDLPVFDPDFATDPVTLGVYAPGVQASVRITATDSRGQTTTRAVPFHVISVDNDAPTFTLSSLAVPDAGNGNMPTLHCDYGAGAPFPAQCTGDLPNFVTNGKPGPVYAYDELATQWTLFAGVGADNKLDCSGSTPSIFSMVLGDRQSPRIVPAGSSTGINYSLSGEAGFSLCTIYFGDGAYPLTQNYNQTVKQFRIVVTK